MQTQKQVRQETSQTSQSVSWSVRWERRTSSLASLLLIDKNQIDPHSSSEPVSGFCSLSNTHKKYDVSKSQLHVADTPTCPLKLGLNRKSTNQSWPMTFDEEADVHHKRRRRRRLTQSRGVWCFFFLKYLPVQMNLRRLSAPDFSPSMEVCCWDTDCLELCAGRWFGSGQDLHVLGKDGLESLVSVDHGAKHQWLEGTEMLGN